MSYRSLTIRQAIDRLNRKFFLPSLQREFVWDDRQIIRLFDSIMRGFPISSFLFWQPRAGSATHWTTYKFIEEIRDGGSHNAVANLNGVSRPVFVLDGQQRLTALNIGLRGTYVAKEKYRRWDNPDAWKRKRLFLDVLHQSRTDDAKEDEGADVRYRFVFQELPPSPTKRSCWFEVGKILHCPTRRSLTVKVRQLLRTLPRTASKNARATVRQTLARLQEAIFKDAVIFFHTETLPDYGRVLDIFVRANEAGTRLTKSDLLLSTLISNWENPDARQEIHDFVDRLNEYLGRDNDLDKDFVIKSCFFLCDLPIRYNITSFTRDNLKKVERQWPRIKLALENCVKLVNRFGIDRNNLTSANALIPIAHYFYHNEGESLLGTSRWDARNAAAIHRWLAMALLNRVFGGASDSMLAALREVLNRSGRRSRDFPVQRLNEAIAKRGRSATFTNQALADLFARQYGERETFLALTLLYDDTYWGTVPHHVDHIFPQRSFSETGLRRAGVRPSDVQRVMELKDRLGNLELLTESENIRKRAQEFSTWVRTRSRSFRDRHLIPTNRRLYSLRNFERFLERRESLIRTRLNRIFSS